jgi:hypothetical protein
LNPINPAIFLGLGACTLGGIQYNPCSATTNTDQRRLLSLERPQDGQFIGAMGEFDDGGTQVYHGMLLSLERRAKGMTLTGNYTLSHCMGTQADINSNGPPADETYTKPNVRDFDRGNCDSDRRQLFNMTAVAETPQFSNAKMRTLASGWRLSGIYRIASGSPLSLLAGTDRALSGVTRQRPDQVLPSVYGDKSAGPLAAYFNLAAVAPQALGTLGNMGWNSVVGPKTWAFDMALSRTFSVREMTKLEVRAEAFNVTNSFRPGNPNTTINNNTFGQIRTALDPRILQFAMKYVF